MYSLYHISGPDMERVLMEYLKNVVTLKLDSDLCTGCSVCTQVCPRTVFEMEDRRAKIVSRDACIECGACAKNCISKAISVKVGVGCAAAMINGILTTGDPSKGSCGCSGGGCCYKKSYSLHTNFLSSLFEQKNKDAIKPVHMVVETSVENFAKTA